MATAPARGSRAALALLLLLVLAPAARAIAPAPSGDTRASREAAPKAAAAEAAAAEASVAEAAAERPRRDRGEGHGHALMRQEARPPRSAHAARLSDDVDKTPDCVCGPLEDDDEESGFEDEEDGQEGCPVTPVSSAMGMNVCPPGSVDMTIAECTANNVDDTHMISNKNTDEYPGGCAINIYSSWGDVEKERFFNTNPVGGTESNSAKVCKKKCRVRKKPIDCKYGSWQKWSKCSKPCGGGKRTRRRVIEVEAQGLGLKCGTSASSLKQKGTCNKKACTTTSTTTVTIKSGAAGAGGPAALFAHVALAALGAVGAALLP